MILVNLIIIIKIFLIDYIGFYYIINPYIFFDTKL